LGALLACSAEARNDPAPFANAATDHFMDNTSSPTKTNAPSATPTTPFPVSNGDASGAKPTSTGASGSGDSNSNSNSNSSSTADEVADAAAAAIPVLDRLIKQATTGAHDAIDSLSSKASSLADGLQGGVSKAGDTRDEWIESARDAIRQHPFATVAGALVIGAALLSLRSSRRD
jgi:ElaB/YqjD/DUF883 family membrane-anchored ribosome-binding protein